MLKHYTLKRKPAQNPADVEKLAAEPTLPANDGGEQYETASPARTVREDLEDTTDEKFASTAKS